MLIYYITSDFRDAKYKIEDSLYSNFIRNGFRAYLATLNDAKKTGNYKDANKLLDAFKKTQHQYGASVMINDKKVDTEVLYNKYDIFKKLYSWYMYAGSLLFIILIIEIFKSRSKAMWLGQLCFLDWCLEEKVTLPLQLLLL